MKSIGSKIAGLFVVSTIVLILLMGIISGIQSSKLLINEAKEKNELLAQNKSILLSGQMDIMKNAVDNLALNVSSQIDESKISDSNYMEETMVKINKIVESSAKSVTGNTDSYAIFNPEVTKSTKVYHCLMVRNNDAFENAGEVLTLEQTKSKDKAMEWYFKPIEQKKGIWSNPYEDQNLKQKLITYSAPIYVNNKIIGTVGMDIKFEIFENIVKDIKTYKTGYAYLLSKDYTFLSHPSIKENTTYKEIFGEDSDRLIEAMDKKNSGIEEIVFDGKERFMGFSRLNNGFIFVVSTPKDEILDGVNSMLYNLGIIGFVVVILSILLGLFTGKTISKPIKKLMNIMTEVEKGDLTCTVEILSKDEIGQLAKSFNSMLIGEKTIISEVNSTSHNTENSAVMLVDISKKMSCSYNEMTNAIHEIAESSTLQAQSLENILHVMEQFNGEVSKVVEAAKEVELETKGINKMAQSSDEQLKLVVNSIDNISSAFGNVKNDIFKLTSNITEVNSIIQVINEIAEQTNLLALNASIEAARAGEAGKGFAIVAQEIGKLAEQTKVSSHNINNSLNGISKTAEGVIVTTENVNHKFSEQINVVENAINSFEKIVNAVETILPRVQNIGLSIGNINSQKDGITSNIETVSAVAEQVSAATQEVSASIEEMNESSQNVETTAKHLDKLSKKLIDEVKRFKV